MSAPRMYVIYGLVETRPGHRFNGRIRYVGQTCNLTNRINGYRVGRGHNPHLSRWLRVCPNFQVRELGSAIGWKAAIETEKEIIARYGVYKSPHGLNALPGGTGTWDFAHRSLSQPGPVRDGWIASLRASQVDVLKSKEHRKALSVAALKQRWKCSDCDIVSNAGSIGRHQSLSGHSGRTVATAEDVQRDFARRQSNPRQRVGCGRDRWVCTTCGRIMNAGQMSRHHKANNHAGKELVS